MSYQERDPLEAPGSGWLVFAGIMLMIVGSLNVIWGIAAIADARVFTENQTIVFTNLSAWGWIVLIVGVIELFAGFGVLNRSQWARWFGIGVASLNLIAQMFVVAAFPAWALTIMTIDVLVVYGLAAYGGRLGT